RLLADLTEVIATEGAAIVSATVEPPSEQRVRHTYTLQLPDAAGLPALMRAATVRAGRADSRSACCTPLGADCVPLCWPPHRPPSLPRPCLRPHRSAS